MNFVELGSSQLSVKHLVVHQPLAVGPPSRKKQKLKSSTCPTNEAQGSDKDPGPLTTCKSSLLSDPATQTWERPRAIPSLLRLLESVPWFYLKSRVYILKMFIKL